MEPEALNKLMLKEGTTYHSVTPRFSDWASTGALDKESVELLESFEALNSVERSDLIRSNETITRAAEKLLVGATLRRLQRYLLGMLNDRDAFEIYFDIATHEEDVKIVEKTFFLLCGLVACDKSRFSNEQVVNLLGAILSSKIDAAPQLYAIANILGEESYRSLVFENEAIRELIKSCLSTSVPANAQYKAAYCMWHFSRTEDYIEAMYDQGMIHDLCCLFCSTKIEKIIRVCLLLLKNLFASTRCLELIVEKNVGQTLALLVYDKWRDLELYDNIQRLRLNLESKSSKMSNFERYVLELNTGFLKWSILHSEKFWAVHFGKFEQDEFSIISKLVKLLYASEDPTTIAVACFDLGEFARLYHNGKKICQKFGVKDRVMELIGNRDRDIAREAMLCAQKLMVQKWNQVSST
ncbi:ARM repeat protein [Babesia gibsoni]|uniref:ARM repeat protein n=1 Tax=Babesia gibsoni TaxID=33632 RepID=A0AAD8PGD1_BABGI|nr:ARM repeat protein [Babesia gibsoni]